MHLIPCQADHHPTHIAFLAVVFSSTDLQLSPNRSSAEWVSLPGGINTGLITKRLTILGHAFTFKGAVKFAKYSMCQAKKYGVSSNYRVIFLIS